MRAGWKAFFLEQKQKTLVPAAGTSEHGGFLGDPAASAAVLKTGCLFALLLILAPSHAALADAATRNNLGGVSATTGEGIYQHVCQGCHMPGAVGAVGAGRFPALANNKRLSAAGYPVAMVLRGNGGMPWFNGVLDDEQISAVVNYVRTHFGNTYTDAVTPAYVASVKGPTPVGEQ